MTNISSLWKKSVLVAFVVNFGKFHSGSTVKIREATPYTVNIKLFPIVYPDVW